MSVVDAQNYFRQLTDAVVSNPHEKTIWFFKRKSFITGISSHPWHSAQRYYCRNSKITSLLKEKLKF